jgi:hypothetical protein
MVIAIRTLSCKKIATVVLVENNSPMKSKNIIYGIIGLVVIMIVWILGDTFSQPGIADLEGDYKEMATYRNENNTGPVVRIYAVYAADTLWKDMEAYSNFMPHTKYGNTKVFFFSDPSQTPAEVFPEPPYFDQKYQAYCIAQYEKSAMGETNFLRFPFQ